MRGLDVRGVLEFMAEMTLRTGYPVPAPPGFASEWSRGLRVGREGSRRLLFTGALYQLVPYVEASVSLLAALEERGAGWALRAGRAVSMALSGALRGLVRPDPRLVEEYNGIVRSIALLLAESGADFAYVPEVSDMYSGAILYDMGVADAFEAHARRVARAIESTGAEEVIAIDPHTALTLLAYREVVGLDVRVSTYLEYVRPRPGPRGLRVAVHDSCIYARRLGLSGRVRELLRAAGAEVVEPRRSGERTSCCGGPVEALSPGLARSVASERAAELAEASSVVVTMCPICRANLSRAARGGLKFVDLAQVLAGAV